MKWIWELLSLCNTVYGSIYMGPRVSATFPFLWVSAFAFFILYNDHWAYFLNSEKAFILLVIHRAKFRLKR